MNFKKILALVLVVAMCLSMVPTYAFAEDVELWDEDEVAVQNDAPLEDEYIDEDPVEQEPVEEEPAATDPEEPAAEEPAAEEPTGTNEVLGSSETNEFDAAIVIKNITQDKDYEATQFETAISEAAAGDQIMVGDNSVAGSVDINKSLTLIGSYENSLNVTINVLSGTVTLKNFSVNTINVAGGTLSIPEGDTAQFGTVKALNVTSGDVKGGIFNTSLSTVLLAKGYVTNTGKSINGTVSGTVVKGSFVAKVGNDLYTTLQDAIDNATAGSTITLLDNITVVNNAEKPNALFTVDKNLTIDGDSHTITASGVASTVTTVGHVFNINGGAVTLKNLTIDGVNKNARIGVHVYKDTAGVTLNNVTVKNCTLGVCVNGSKVTATNLYTSGNEWGGVNVESMNGNSEFTISSGKLEEAASVYSEDSSSGGASGNNNKVKITGGDFNGVQAKAKADVFAISGGTYLTEFPDTYCAEGFILVKKDDGTYGVDSGTYVARVADMVQKNVDYTTLGQGYTTLDEAIAAAKAPVEEGKPEHVLVILNKVKSTDKIALNDGEKINIWYKAGIALADRYAKENFEVGEYVKVEEIGAPYYVHTWAATGYLALVSTKGSTADPDKFMTLDGDTGAVKAAANAKEKVLKVLKATDTDITLTEEGLFINIDETEGQNVSVNAADGLVAVPVGEGIVTYVAKKAVASYVDAAGNDVYTMTFAEAATKGATNADYEGNFTVKLYQAPAFNDTTKDVYALGANYTLKVVATDSDLKDKLEAKVGNYKAPLYKLMVTNDGEVAVAATHTERDDNFVYTAMPPVAKAPLNTAELTYQYFATVNEAIKFVVEEHYNDNLYLIPMADGVFTVTKDQIDTAKSEDSYWGKDIRIDNSGEKKIRLADAQDPAENPTRFWTYSVNTEASTENYTSYTLKDAAVKIPAKAEMNIYYDVVPGTNTKFFASFAEAVAADSTAVIELIATPTDAKKQYTEETYKLGEPEGPTTVKAKLGEFKWLKVDPYSDNQAVVGDTDKDGITTYTLTGAVASITTGTGAQAQTVKYSTFKEAADIATHTDNPKKVVKLLASISEEYELAYGATLKVNKNTFDVKVVADKDAVTAYAIKETTDKNGITTYEAVDAVAKINFGTEEEEKYTYYATFAEAAKAAFTPAGTEPTLAVVLCQDNFSDEDKYEVKAAGSFLVDVSEHSKNVTSDNLSYAKDAAIVKPATAKEIRTNIWRVTIEAGVAAITEGTATTYYATFADAAKVATATTLASAKTIKLYATVEDEYELATDAYMKVEKGSYNLDVKAAKSADPTRGYIADAVTDPETGITTYSPVYAQASVGTGTDIEFYKEFTVAATEAAETKVITLYNTSTAAQSTYTYTLGAEGNVSKLIVDVNGQALTVTSGVTGKEVKKTTGTDTVTYTLVSPVAHIEENGQADKYYPTVADAVAAAQVGSAQTPTKTLVLDENVTANITISDGKQIDLKAGSYLGNYKVVSANSTSGKPYLVVPTANGDVTNYKSVEAVASIQAADATEPTYYATFAEAAKIAYVTGDATPTLTVKLYKQPQGKSTDPKDVPDLFTVTEVGSILIDKSASASINVEPNFDLADGLVYTYKSKGNSVFHITIAEAEAYTIRNNGKYDYYATVAEACDFSAEQTSHPVVYLQKNELSYALAEGKTIRVDKNSHDDFVVTKATPSDLTPAYAIIETVSGTVSTYTTKTPVIAYILTEDEKPVGDGYDVQKIRNIAYYTNMADASKASNGTETITLTATMTDVYKLSANETLIIDKTVNGYEPKLTADAGSAVKETKVQGKATVYTYEVEQSVATITYTNGDVVGFTTLTEALDEAVSNFDNGVYLTLTAPVEAGFTYTLGELDWVRMAKQTATLSLKVSNFKVPGGMFANITEEPIGDTSTPTYYVVRPANLFASVGEGEKIQYFATFTDAVEAVVTIEDELGHYGDVNNPKSVITLYADNKGSYELTTSGVQSLRIKADKHETGLTAATGYFVEEIPENEEGVSLYKLSKIVASVESGPNNDRKTTYYSSFTAAATAAHNTVESVVLEIAQNQLDPEDIYELPVGTLQVSAKNVNNFADLQEKHIKAKGEKAFINSEWIASGNYQLFTVSGAVASITTPRGTSFYYNMFNAIKAAINNTDLVIVPLTDIDYYMTASEVSTLGVNPVAGSKFNVADSEYDVNLRAEGYELVEKDNIYTFTDAVAFVVTDDVYAVDPETNKPTYIKQYFATIDDAIDFADGEKTITLLANVSYEFEDVDTVAIIATPTSLTFTATLDEELKDDYAVKETTAPNIKKYEVAAKETFRVEAGDGAWGTGTSAVKFKEIKAIAGASIDNSIISFEIDKMALTGYSVEYFVGSDGNNYASTFGSRELTPAETAAKCKVLPRVMPEGGLTLTAKWKANEYWIDYARMDNGTRVVIKTDKLTYDELLTVPADVTVLNHYDFVGWFTDQECTPAKAFDVTKTKITAELGLINDLSKPATGDTYGNAEGYMTLYGKFVPKQYTASFDTGCDVTIPDQTVAYNNTVTKPNDNLLEGKRVGYTFAGTWHYVNENGVNVPWDFENATVSGDVTLIADWNAKKLAITWADGSYVIQQDGEKDVGTPTDAPSYAGRTKPGYRVDPDKAWIDENGDLFNGTVPVKETINNKWIYQLNWIKQVEVIFVDGGKKIGSVLVDQGSTLASAKDVPAPTKEGYTLVWQLDGEDYDVKAPIQEDLLLTAYWAEGEDVRGYATVSSALQLRDNINVFAYVTIKENTLPSDYEVNVTFNGKTTVTGSLDSVADYVPEYDEYRLSDIATIAVPQMNDAATVTITYQGKEVLTKDLSVRGYAEYWIEKNSDARLVNLLKALLDFGAYGQLQFNYQTDNLVNSKYSTGKVPATVVPVYPITENGEATGITGASISLTLLSNTTMNVYIGVEKRGNYKFTVDGVAAVAEYSNKEYKLSVNNINVANLDDEHVITATLGDETYTVTVAPLAYAYQHQGNDSLGNVCKAVYLYYDAADAYFG